MIRTLRNRVTIDQSNSHQIQVSQLLFPSPPIQVFDKIRADHPERLKKLRIVKGDVTEESLGLSEDDIKEMANYVSIVFHCAANVRFDQPLKGACNMNTQGTFRALTVAENFKKLDVC